MFDPYEHNKFRRNLLPTTNSEDQQMTNKFRRNQQIQKKWPTNSEEIYYPQYSNAFIQVRNICCTGSLRMGVGTIFKLRGTSACQKD